MHYPIINTGVFALTIQSLIENQNTERKGHSQGEFCNKKPPLHGNGGFLLFLYKILQFDIVCIATACT